MRTLINKVLHWVKYHFVGYKVDIIKAEITIGKLTNRIDKHYDELESRIDALDEDINDDVFVKRCAELQTKLDKVIEDNKELRNNINLTN